MKVTLVILGLVAWVLMLHKLIGDPNVGALVGSVGMVIAVVVAVLLSAKR